MNAPFRNRFEFAGILIFILIGLAATLQIKPSDLSGRVATQHVAVPTDRYAEVIQQSLQQNPLPHIVAGQLSSRDTNALKAKYDLQRQIEILSQYAVQKNGRVTLGNVYYSLAKRDEKNRKVKELTIVQQIEIHLPGAPDGMAIENELLGKGIQYWAE